MWLLPQVMLLCGVLLVAEAILAMGASHAVSIKDLAGVSGGTLVPRVAGVSRAALVLCATGILASALVLGAIGVSGDALALGATLAVMPRVRVPKTERIRHP